MTSHRDLDDESLEAFTGRGKPPGVGQIDVIEFGEPQPDEVRDRALKSFQSWRGFRDAALTGQYRVVAVLPVVPTQDGEP